MKTKRENKTMSNENQTTARLKRATKVKAHKAALDHKFKNFETALDTFILLGIKSYRQSASSIKASESINAN